MRQTGRMKNQESYLDGFQLGKRISENPRNKSFPRYQAGHFIRGVLFFYAHTPHRARCKGFVGTDGITSKSMCLVPKM